MTWYYCLALAAPWAVTWVSLHSLHRKVDKLMSDVQTLSDTLDAIAIDVSTVATEVATLEQELQDLQNNTPPEVDLTDVIAKANAIRTSLESIGTTASAPPADATPTEPVPVDSSPPSDTPPSDTPVDNSGA